VLVLLLQRVSVWFLGRSLRRPVQGRVACDPVAGKVLGSNVVVSEVLGSKGAVGSRVLASEVAVGNSVAGTEILGGRGHRGARGRLLR